MLARQGICPCLQEVEAQLLGHSLQLICVSICCTLITKNIANLIESRSCNLQVQSEETA